MIRRLFNVASVVSLLLFVTVLVLWVRSYGGGLTVTYLGSRIVEVWCSGGMIAADVRTCRGGWRYTARWTLETCGGAEL